MIRRAMVILSLAGLVLTACACAGPADTLTLPPTTAATTAASSTPIQPLPSPSLAAPATAAPTSPAATLAPAATRAGAEYVLRLPREAAVPADWVMNPPPDFQTRDPQPGATYRFACQELPARSTGVATVGYRSLLGLPSVAIEYVVYPSADDAAAALADMRAAADACASFTIGPDAATAATLAPLDFPAFGDDSFAAALTTASDTTGGLVTHVVKIQVGHVVAGISHSRDAEDDPPDHALTRSLAEEVVALLSGPVP